MKTFDELVKSRERHIHAERAHAEQACDTLCWLCSPFEHTHSGECPMPGCDWCDELVGAAMLDSAMREEREAS